MKEVKTVWYKWTGWNLEKSENWLEEMEQNGWNLIKADLPMRFKFERGKSRKIRYCFDYHDNAENDYFEIFKEDGWELVDYNNPGWYIWRKSYEDERPKIYTDTKSLVERNNRQIRNIIIAAFISIFFLFLVLIGNFDGTKLISVLLIISLILYGYLIVQILRYNKELKQNAVKC